MAPEAYVSTRLPAAAEELLAFWFAERAKKLWFERNDAFDEEIRSRFGRLAAEGARGALAGWEEAATSALALVILLDQFPRNMHRGRADAFACDPLARAVAGRAIDRGFDLMLHRDRRFFFYLPFEHSEDLAEQANFSGNVRTVDVQMTRLRRKIERDPKYPRYLQTVRGTGYVLKPD